MDCIITDFGARVGDRLQTDAIQAAIDACFLAGGGTVTVPCGVFRTGGVRLRSGVTLYLKAGAYLEGSDNPEDYLGFWEDTLEPVSPASVEVRSSDPLSRWNNGLIKAIDAHDIAIIGEVGSYIDGVDCYDAEGEEGYRGPHAINLQHCERVTLRGYTVRRSANWAHAIFRSSDVHIQNVTVYGGHDGIDIFLCDRVLIEECRILSGDDSIAGYDNYDVIVRNCYFESACSTFRFGGHKVLVENCTSAAPAAFGHRWELNADERAARVNSDKCRHNTLTTFLYYCDYRFRQPLRHTPGDILVRNCTFAGADTVFEMDFGSHVWCNHRPLTSIRFENCRFTDVCHPSKLFGGADEPLCFEMEDSVITARAGCEDMAVLQARDYERISLKHVALDNFRTPHAVVLTDGVCEMDIPVKKQ